MRYLHFNLKLPNSPTTDQIRDRLDEVLEDKSLPASAFLITNDYKTDLYKGAEPEDLKRLIRLVEDPRMTNFDLLHSHARKPEAARLREAILRRLLQLAHEDKQLFYMLQSVAVNFDKDAYRNPIPAFDALLADPQARVLSDRLIPRLAERGEAAAPVVLSLLEALWADNPTTREQREAIEAASKCLCRLGPDARSILPAVMNLHNRHYTHELTASLEWRASLVAIGADPDTFPTTRNLTQDAYRNMLLKTMKTCARR